MSVTLEIERAIRERADWYRCMLLPEAPVRIDCGKQRRLVGTPHEYGWPHYVDYLADFISVTDAGYATEYEVKVSRSDWRVDKEKPKWRVGFPPYISRFIYVVPEALVRTKKRAATMGDIEWVIPEWVPPQAGIWALRESRRKYEHYTDTHVHVVRNPQRIGKEKVPPARLELWQRTFYYRFWRLRIDGDRRMWDAQRQRWLDRQAASNTPSAAQPEGDDERSAESV